MRIKIGEVALPYGRRIDIFQINNSPKGNNLVGIIVNPNGDTKSPPECSTKDVV